MEINKHIIDQRITKIVQDLPQWFEKSNDTHQKKSKAFVLLSVASYLGFELEEANHLMTEGGNDAGVDAIFIGDLNDYEFPVILFQGKYTFNLDKQTNFPANAIQTIIGAVGSIFDPSKPLLMNELLKSKVSEVRSLISDGYIPNVKCICVNNGLTWTQAGNHHIENAGFPSNQVQFEYFNHDDIVKLLQTKKGVRATLPFAGKSLVDDFNYKRVLIGKVNVLAFAQLFEKYGDLLLEKNIWRYLGFHKNRVNESIKETLIGDKKEHFYFYNNGITIVCNKFSYNALQGSDWNVTMEDLQIINGGQSCKTIQQTVKNHPEIDYSQVYVLVRLYELSGANVANMISDITIATNSQNPVDLRDLRANDALQSALSLAIKGLGYHYKTKKDMMSAGNGENMPSSVLAESVFTIWREKPHLAKFKKTELFGKFYDAIFNDLNAAQAILAVLIYRFCDNQRRNTSLYAAHPHLPYSNYFLAMLMGRFLLERLKLKLPQLTHQEFDIAKQYLEIHKETLFLDANSLLESVLLQWFPKGLHEMEPRRLSAAFRRGDVLNDLSG